MLKLKPFKIDDWEYLQKWISNESELIQFAGPIFTYPIDQRQVALYLSDTKRIVFRIEHGHRKTVGIAEIYLPKKNVAKLARILIGEKSMRAKGLGTALMNILVDFVCRELNKEKIIPNVFSWNIGAIKCYEKVGFVQTDKPIEVMKVGNEEWEIMEMAKNGVTGRN